MEWLDWLCQMHRGTDPQFIEFIAEATVRAHEMGRTISANKMLRSMLTTFEGVPPEEFPKRRNVYIIRNHVMEKLGKGEKDQQEEGDGRKVFDDPPIALADILDYPSPISDILARISLDIMVDEGRNLRRVESKWMARLASFSPPPPSDTIRNLAAAYVNRERMAFYLSDGTPPDFNDLDGYVLFRPWESKEAKRVYELAIAQKRVRGLTTSALFPNFEDLDDVRPFLRRRTVARWVPEEMTEHKRRTWILLARERIERGERLDGQSAQEIKSMVLDEEALSERIRTGLIEVSEQMSE